MIPLVANPGPTVSRARKEEIYREYMSFFERAERQRRWRLETDIPWEDLDPSLNTEDDAVRLETYCGVELYVPDYTANGFVINRSVMGMGWFQACWGYEESKHALAFKEYLVRSGLRTRDQYLDYEDEILARVWELPYQTRRQMICYGALQEAVTYHIYRHQKQRHRALGNSVLERIFFLVSRDEAAHAGFYRALLKLEFESDHESTLVDLAHVVFNFKMPGVALIPGYESRVQIEGVGLSSSDMLKEAVFPLLRTFGVKRKDLFRAASASPTAPDPEFVAEALAHEERKRSELSPPGNS